MSILIGLFVLMIIGIYYFKKGEEGFGGLCMALSGLALILWALYWLIILYTE